MNQLPISELISLKNKTALVTGGAMGIGFGIAYRLAEAGATVVIADIDETTANDAVKNLIEKGFKASAIMLDVSNPEDVERVVGEIANKYGIDILVNNAGIYPNMTLANTTPESIDKVLGVNLRGSMLMTKFVSLQMIKQGKGGKIINITSVDALHPSSVGLAVYDATKHGLWGFTKSTALELAPHNIQVNAVAPGGINTPGTGEGKQAGPQMEEIIKKFREKIPMKRMGEADEIGKVVLFLASDLASYMTGSQVVVDGGVLLS